MEIPSPLYKLPLLLPPVAAARGREHPGTAGGQRQVPHHERPRRLGVVVVGGPERVRRVRPSQVAVDPDDPDHDGRAQDEEEEHPGLRPPGRRCRALVHDLLGCFGLYQRSRFAGVGVGEGVAVEFLDGFGGGEGVDHQRDVSALVFAVNSVRVDALTLAPVMV
eukprot:CAMPEP_0194286762 /NCGR_PEP_ID=MMETSP0169-20130528/33245_1 /TAXON_ID=218684 /ORGANISM="Corethron pennatum, Strain L29A3" /LENGTH=163 /DNA_ID=CAMNT_0039033275 /DNA_START=268 /DNA_END=759 /DNA_ORIENTATION=-